MTPHEFEPEQLDRLDRTARRELISAYLDGELGADESRAVTLWLDTNPGALREVEHIRRTWDLLDAYEDEPVPEGFAGRVLTAVGIESRPVRARGRVLRMAWYRQPLAVAASLLVAAGALVFAFTRSGGTVAPTPTQAADVTRILDAIPSDLLEDVDYLATADEDEFDAIVLDEDFAELAEGFGRSGSGG